MVVVNFKRALNVSFLFIFYSVFQSLEFCFVSTKFVDLLTSIQFIDQLSHLVHRFKIEKNKIKETTKGNAPGVKTRKLLVYIVTFTC